MAQPIDAFPDDLAKEARIRLLDPSRPMFRSALVLAGIGLLFVAVPALSSKPIPGLVSILGWGLIAFGFVASLLGIKLLRAGPYDLIVGVRALELPSVTAWNPGVRRIAWSEISSIGQALVQNAPNLVVSTESGPPVSIPLSLLPRSFFEQRWPERIAVRMRWACQKGSRAELAGLEALALSSDPLAAVVVEGARKPVVKLAVRSLDVYARMLPELPEGHVLVTGRPDPATATGLEPARLAQMLDVLEEEFRREGIDGRLDRRNLALFASEGSFELFSLCRVCAKQASERWIETVREHVRQLRRATGLAAAALAEASDLDAVRSRLRVVIHAADRAPNPQGSVVRALDPGMVCVLVIAHDEGNVTVPRELLDRWGISRDALFELAMENVSRLPPPERTEATGVCAAVYAGDEYTASRLLALDRLLGSEDQGEGFVVAVPSQRCLIVSPGVVDLIAKGAALSAAVSALHAEDPRPLSPALFCWHRGRLEAIPRRVDGGGALVFELPATYTGRMTGRA